MSCERQGARGESLTSDLGRVDFFSRRGVSKSLALFSGTWVLGGDGAADTGRP